MSTRQCPNCRKEIALENADLHELHCSSRFKYCELCNVCVKKSDYVVHTEDTHYYCGICKGTFPEQGTYHLISCTHCEEKVCPHSTHIRECATALTECPKCKLLVRRDLLSQSHASICPKVSVPCEYCTLQVYREEFTRHKDMCGSRTERCEGCSEYVRASARKTHSCNVYSSQSALHREARSHSERRTGENECVYCNETFGSVEDLEIHICTNHADML